jgi:hypothetical protein
LGVEALDEAVPGAVRPAEAVEQDERLWHGRIL